MSEQARMTYASLAGPRWRTRWQDFARWVASLMPKGLYARSLLIVILPMVILQSVIAYFFMERHWQTVTFRLSAGVVQDIGAVIDLYQMLPEQRDRTDIRRLAGTRLQLDVDMLPKQELPPRLPKPFFSLLDKALSRELALQIEATFAPLAKALYLRTMSIFGGVNQGPQVTRLRDGVDVGEAQLSGVIKAGHGR